MSASPQLSTVSAMVWHAKLIERASSTVAFWVESTDEERATWCPQLEGSAQTRSVLEQVSECARVNRGMTAIFRGEDPSTEVKNYASRQEAADDLRQSGKELASLVRELSTEALTKIYPTRMGRMPGTVLLELALNNMSYHGGAINFIQLLYGDEQFHVPPGFADFTLD